MQSLGRQSSCNYLFDSDLLISQRSCWWGWGQLKTTVLCSCYLRREKTSWPHSDCLVAELVILPVAVWLCSGTCGADSLVKMGFIDADSWGQSAALLQPVVHFWGPPSCWRIQNSEKGEPPSPSLSLWPSNEILDLWHPALSARTKSHLSQRGEQHTDGSTEAAWGSVRR